MGPVICLEMIQSRKKPTNIDVHISYVKIYYNCRKLLF